jgi:pseudouridine-5'-phosphate glycosidase
MTTSRWLHLHPDVRQAVADGRPVVALESTLITHGLPYPVNRDTARALEGAVREEGAVPATIAILQGRVHVGLTAEELESLARAQGVRKCSRRDLPLVLSGQLDGATTVAATMYLAQAAGVRVFATGGIGGVHRGHPFDVSADLEELGRTPVTVVCAGAKAILDLPLTLEVLETKGVPVIGFRTSEFPAFYTRTSGLPVDIRCDSAREVAALMKARDQLGLTAGLLVAVPVPEAHELPQAEAEAAIHGALTEAEARGIRGKEVTPFLLARVSELTGARSRDANVALLLNNARVAAAIAIAAAAG